MGLWLASPTEDFVSFFATDLSRFSGASHEAKARLKQIMEISFDNHPDLCSSLIYDEVSVFLLR